MSTQPVHFIGAIWKVDSKGFMASIAHSTLNAVRPLGNRKGTLELTA